MKLAILDGTNLVHRAYYGVRQMSTKDGLYTNAVFGFFNILQKLLEEEKPDAMCVALDSHAPNFRVQKYAEYKAQRSAMDEELRMQMPLISELLDACRIPHVAVEGYEADDIIGTYARLASEQGVEAVVVTGDRDMLQLVSEETRVKLVITAMGRTTTTDYTPELFREEYGFDPPRMVDLKALMGDSSDNIPGVPGIGKKTATDLLVKFGSLDGVYTNLEDPAVKPGVRKKLEAGRELAQLSFDLATIDRFMPPPRTIESMVLPAGENGLPYDKAALYDFCVKLEFRTFITRLGLEPGEEAPREKAVQLEHLTEDRRETLESLCDGEVAVICHPELLAVALCGGGTVYLLRQADYSPMGYTAALQKIFGPETKKRVHGAKQFLHTAERAGLNCGGLVGDTELGAYLLDPVSGKYPLEKLALSRLQRDLPPESAYTSAVFGPLSETETEEKAMAAYAAALYELWPLLRRELEELDLWKLYSELELPLARTIAEMESVGILVDAGAIERFGTLLSERAEQAQAAVYTYAGEEFNINSTKILGEVLFEKLGLPPVKKTKTGYSTDVDVLEKLKHRHPIIGEIMEYRQLTKLKSTYCDGLLKVIGPDGRIHSKFNMTATATGRLSSAEPNLQNIPVRTELGSELRRMFVAKPGCVLVDADYSQIELRVLAHIAGDKAMTDAFLRGVDIHTATAAQVFGVAESEVTGELRRRAKAVNFGIVYGISDFSLGEDLGVSRAEAKSYIESYLALYSGIRDYMERTVAEAKERGYVTTLLGRRRWIPELASKNYNIRSFGERAAMNTPIQGSAADIIKLAMLHVAERLKREGMASRLVLQVHDELIVEAPEAEAGRAAALLKEEMEGVMTLSAPLIAETSMGKTWYDAK